MYDHEVGRGGAAAAVFGTPRADYTRALMAATFERLADTRQDGTASGQGRGT